MRKRIKVTLRLSFNYGMSTKLFFGFMNTYTAIGGG